MLLTGFMTKHCAPKHHVGRHRNPSGGRSLRAEILILTARINFNP
jgi:hypothetical protein